MVSSSVDKVDWLKSESEVGKTSYGIAEKQTWVGNCNNQLKTYDWLNVRELVDATSSEGLKENLRRLQV